MEASKNSPIEVKREFPVSRERLYRAWVQAEDLKQWWNPVYGKLVDVDNDIRKGGTVRYSFGSENGEPVVVISGEYSEVQEGRGLVYTWNWETQDASLASGSYELAVSFEGEGEHSTLKVVQKSNDDQEGVFPHREGWENALDDLFSFLTANSQTDDHQVEEEHRTSAESQEGAKSGDTEVEGYNELPEQQNVGG